MRIYIKAFLSGFIFIMGGTWWQATAQNGKDIIIGKRLAFHSDVLQEEREILLHLPASYDQNNYTRYPVLYLLDGQKFFQSFTGATEQLSQDASPQIPEIIIVGISSQNRVRDASPTHSLTGYRGIKEKELEASGGADKFLSFVKTELIPFIDSSYRTQPYRLFTGYSFTGLPVLHSLFTQPGLFNSYLVIDFSAWWDNQVTLKKMMGFFKQEVLKKADVFLCTEERVKNSVYPERVNATWTFIKAFEKLHPSSISMGYKKYGLRQENHHSMPLQAFMDGLRYLFRGYMINYDEMYDQPKRIQLKFDSLSVRMGYKVLPREDLLSFLSYQFLYTHPDKKKALFYLQYYLSSYPQSSGAYERLGDYYKQENDKQKAILNYKRSIELNSSNSSSQDKLKSLEN